MGQGLTAGNSRVARIARFLKSAGGNSKAHALRVVVADGDAHVVLATYDGGASTFPPTLAVELDGLLVDYATACGGARNGHLHVEDEQGKVLSSCRVNARPAANALDVEEVGDSEMDGSSRSVAVQLQRHMEVRARLDATRDVGFHDAYKGIIGLLSETVERFADRIVAQEEATADARQELQHLREEVAEEAAEMAADGGQATNAAEVGKLVLQLAASYAARQQASPKGSPASASPPEGDGSEESGG